MTMISEVFDTAITKLEAQTEKAFDKDTQACKYRLGSCACFFGHMITDEHYDPIWDLDNGGLSASVFTIRHAIEKSQGISLSNYLSSTQLDSLQIIHDQDWQPGQPFRPLIPKDIQRKIWPDQEPVLNQ